MYHLQYKSPPEILCCRFQNIQSPFSSLAMNYELFFPFQLAVSCPIFFGLYTIFFSKHLKCQEGAVYSISLEEI